MWEEVETAPPPGFKEEDVKGSRLYRKESLVSRTFFVFGEEI